MTTQTYRDEGNWKHEPNTEHHVDDKFGKGTNTRNWKKNIEEEESLETKKDDSPEDENNESVPRQ